MWVEIKEDLFQNANLTTLNRLISLLTWNPAGSVSRYNVLVHPNVVENNETFKQLPLALQGVLKEEFNTYVITNASIKYVISGRKISEYLELEEAISFFEQPLTILLENGLNDSHFILALINNFGRKNSSNQRLLSEHIKNRWIIFDNAGGCSNVKNVIVSKLNSFGWLSAKFKKHSYQYIRCIIILDSDKEYPTEPVKNNYQVLISYFEEIKFSTYHILEKRMIENYMPEDVYRAINTGSLKKWIHTYLELTPIQKDFLNISKGFSKELDKNGIRVPIRQEILDLYNLANPAFDILDRGFAYPKIKTRFPELFVKNPHSNKATLLARANSNEFLRIINLIESNI
jgi:hypothetical protein